MMEGMQQQEVQVKKADGGQQRSSQKGEDSTEMKKGG